MGFNSQLCLGSAGCIRAAALTAEHPTGPRSTLAVTCRISYGICITGAKTWMLQSCACIFSSRRVG